MAERLRARRGDHSSGTLIAERLKQPTRTTRPTDRPRLSFRLAHRSYSVLLPAGLALPLTLPPARCALTAPFHPYPLPKRQAVCFLWRFPWGRPRRTLSGAVSVWSPDFPLFAKTAVARPTGERALRRPRSCGQAGDGFRGCHGGAI